MIYIFCVILSDSAGVGDITVVITIPVATQMYKTSFVYHNKGGGQAEREGIWKSSTLQWTCALHTGTTLISEIHRSYNFRTSGEMDRVHVAVNHATDMRRCVYLRGQVSRQVGPPIVGIIAENCSYCCVTLASLAEKPAFGKLLCFGARALAHQHRWFSDRTSAPMADPVNDGKGP